LPFGSRVLAWALVAAEVLVSQTLSVVVAAAGGAIVFIILEWRQFSHRTRHVFLWVAAAVAAVLISLALLPGSRFNLLARLGEDSAGYRYNETWAVLQLLSGDVLSMVFG